MATVQGRGLGSLAGKIKDRTMKPGYGYDFESFSSPRVPRFIEVKTLTRNGAADARFFVSAHEIATARMKAIAPYYYFYLVSYFGEEPVSVEVWKGSELYKAVTLEAQNFLVRLSSTDGKSR